ASDFTDELMHPRVWLGASRRTPIEMFNDRFTGEVRGLDPFNASKVISYAQLSQYIIPTLGDRVEMAHSIEGRTPFLDRDLVEFVATVPPRHFMNVEELREKLLLREAFAGELPEFLKREHKHPFVTPSWRTLYKTPAGRELVNDTLDSRYVDRTEIFMPRFVKLLRILWPLLPRGSALSKKVDILVGMVVTTLLLHKLYVDRAPPPASALDMADCTWKFTQGC
ncbi:MAG TPA: asparagine synthase-related protein, partial [Bdellovibrionales bacterium]|nr:asparagine synthase-related protein [Bdellovibrionales bacterium]